MIEAKQVPLRYAIDPQRTLQQFHPGSNAEALEWVSRTVATQSEPLLYLWGPQGTGKSHLLQAACLEARHTGLNAMYLPLGELAGFGPQIIEDLADQQLVCLDDLDVLPQNMEWEQALFHLYNQLRSQQHNLVVSARQPPIGLSINLPDLKSRLGWGLTLRLQAPDESTLLEILQQRSRTLGMTLSPAVGHYLLTRFPRDLPFLLELLHQLDQATLTAQKSLTIPFIKNHLKD